MSSQAKLARTEQRKDETISSYFGRIEVELNVALERLQEIVDYCEPHKQYMWAKYIQGIALNKKDWRD